MVTLPTVGGNINTWGPLVNAAILAIEDMAEVNAADIAALGGGAATMPFHTAKEFGAIGDGDLHPLSEVYGTLGAAQAVYPFVTALTQQIDSAAIRLMMEVTAPNIGHLGYTPPGYEGLGGICFVETGQYMCDISIPVQSRQRLIGGGQGDDFGGCSLTRVTGANHDLIVAGANGYDWHAGEVAHFGLRGNRRLAGAGSGGNTAGRGLVCNSIMETSEVHHIYSVANPSDGFYITGGVPGTIRKCSSFHNGGWGFNMDAFGNAMLLDSPSGDMNDDGFIRIRGHSADGTSQLGSTNSITIINLKAERGNVIANGWSTEATHDPAILIDQFGGPVTIIGGTMTGHGEGSTTPEIGEVAIRREADSEYATVIIINLVMSHYETEYEDLFDAARTVSTAGPTGNTRTLNINTSQPAAASVIDASATWTNTAQLAGASLRQYVAMPGLLQDAFVLGSSSGRSTGQWRFDVIAEVGGGAAYFTCTNLNAYTDTANLGTIYLRGIPR